MTKYTFKMISRDDGQDSLKDYGIYLEVYNNDGDEEALRRAKYQNKKNKWRSKMVLVEKENNQTAYERKGGIPDEGPSVWYISPPFRRRVQ